jgi:hypothetical protein
MHDRFSIVRNGIRYEAGRFLRREGGRTYQTIFYSDLSRCDLVPYAQFASDDDAMNASAVRMLESMIEQATPSVERDFYF